jgi:hypothetical protein
MVYRQTEANMPGDPRECRAHARNCHKLAESASTAEVRRTFVDLAHSWTKLAVELEDAGSLLTALNEIEQNPSGSTEPPAAAVT